MIPTSKVVPSWNGEQVALGFHESPNQPDVLVIDAATGKQSIGLKGHMGDVTAVAFTPDGRRMAAAATPNELFLEGAVRIWDLTTGLELVRWKKDNGQLDRLLFDKDGSRLLLGLRDGHPSFLQFWDARPLNETAPEIDRFTEARRIAEWVVAAAKSRADLVSRIEAHPGITEEVRQKVREVAPRYWSAELSVRADYVVKKLFGKFLLKADVLASLQEDLTLDDEVRSEALRQAERDHDDGNRLNAASWAIVVRRDAKADDYQRALRWADAACKLQPDDGNALNTLGVAQYRVGEFETALATLTRSLKLNTVDGVPQPTDLAFLAMTHHALGNAAEAKSLLDELRELAIQPKWKDDVDMQGFLREAEQLFVERLSPPATKQGDDADGR